jgi:hypothetical protein
MKIVVVNAEGGALRAIVAIVIETDRLSGEPTYDASIKAILRTR